ncbi:MFS transporter [Streptomyces sp. NBC_00582]|uniref:MFS transporter n=1 Tax=Streptomyces sp. NBC_00582 TaxID=2975783 RepID=UPI002E809E06|nr:MFS transporter [Streptomyces sp. NBC_00582]WUB65670.1 MFS transporter [Streptomyces sp. NBC_00582]
MATEQTRTTSPPTRARTAAEPPRPAARAWRTRLLMAGIVLAALNLRPAITSLGALLEEVRDGLGMSGGMAGLLTSVPPLCFAVFGVMAPRLARRFGPGAVVCAGMVAITAGLLIRPYTGATAGFLAASALALMGIAVSNVLMPVIVKRHFPDRVGSLTGLYSMALALGTSAAAALTVPLTGALGGGWRPGLALWAALAATAVLPWLPFVRDGREPPADRREAPAERRQAPAESRRTPAEPWQAPAESRRTPAEPWQAPAESRRTPAEPWQAPAESRRTPAEPWQAPAESRRTPAERRQAPAESRRTSAEPWQALAEPRQAPAEPRQAPAEPGKAGPAPVSHARVEPPVVLRVTRSRTAWALAVFFGLQATAAYVTMGWMAQIFRDAGVSAGESGLLLAVTMAMGVPLAYVIPRVASWLPQQGPIAVVLGVCGLAGYAGLYLAPAEGAWAWAVLLGMANCAFPLALTMVGMRARTGTGVAKLSAFAQSTGYLISIPGPLLVGVLYQHSGGWGLPLALMAALMLPQMAVGVLAGRARTVEDETAGRRPRSSTR